MGQDEIKRAIARVTAEKDDDGQSTGTAFYIGDKYALTALHVVADINKNPPDFYGSIKLEFTGMHSIEAKIVEKFWDKNNDWAVLECTEPPQVKGISCGTTPNRGDNWWSHGYPNINPTGMTIDGDISDLEVRDENSSVIQLFCKQAAAGHGAHLHGFSGAPCLVDDKVTGILRYTLIEELSDGSLQLQLFTQAGTAYACSSKSIIDWQAHKGISVLPNSWSPPDIVCKDFVVFLSVAEGESEHGKKLCDVVQNVYRELKNKTKSIGEPYVAVAADIVASEEKLMQAINALCRAKVVVFDATDFEPAIMLLAGIRAVVKRGVTILSVGRDYALGKQLAIPFNIMDANIVAHSQEQDNLGIINSVELLSSRIRRGLEEIESPYYLDLPVFDALRRIPAERRGIIASEEGVLVLCPFDENYTENNWRNKLKCAFENELRVLRNTCNLQVKPKLGIARCFELNSPRLFTQAFYEAMRCAQACVVDLTDWSPNVLFELGVRLAASREKTVCIIDKNWNKENALPNWEQQCESLKKLFVSDELQYDSSRDWTKERAYQMAYGHDAVPPTSELSSGAVYELIEKELDVDGEPASYPVYQELLDSASLFARSSEEATLAGKSKPVGLYPGNPTLTRREEEADFERLLAAWFYLSNRFPNELQKTKREVALRILTTLFLRHSGKLDQVKKDFKEALKKQFNMIEHLSDEL